MKKLTKKFILVMVLLLALGCVSKGGTTLLPIHKRPHLPRAITEPTEVFLKCDDDPRTVESLYYCIEAGYLEELRVYTIEMSQLVSKYENATVVFNE